MSPRRGKRAAAPVEPVPAPPPGQPADTTDALPRGRIPAVGIRELVAAIHRRRDRRRAASAELAEAVRQLSGSLERHLARVAELRAAVEAQGGDLSHLKHYDTMMARLRAELRTAERALADVFSTAAKA